jgi:FdhE protein
MSRSAYSPEGARGAVPPVRLPEPAGVFERRAARFRALAPGHAIGEYLAVLAHLAEAQRLASQIVTVDRGGRALLPAVPLQVGAWRPDKPWRQALSLILTRMQALSLPEAARAAVAGIEGKPPGVVEAWADALLAGAFDAVDLAAAPFVGAALQVYWSVLAAGVPFETIERSWPDCPICGSPPVAGTIGGDDSLRYLTCSLCAAAWHVPRVTCATCGGTAGLSYFGVAEDPRPAKAEACAACRSYLKLFDLEQAPGADPVADDLATLALDLLMAEEGYARAGVNLFLLRAQPAD